MDDSRCLHNPIVIPWIHKRPHHLDIYHRYFAPFKVREFYWNFKISFWIGPEIYDSVVVGPI